MVNFIARMIEKEADKSLAQGKELYRKYFINTKIYAKYKSDVDKILTDDGYKNVIVTK